MIALFCFSCKSRKHVFDQSAQQITQDRVDSILVNHKLDFDWYSVKAKLKFQTPDQSESGTCILRIKHDSIIWMVLKKFSREGIRMQMNQDSITLINRLNKSATSWSWPNLSTAYGLRLDYALVQDLLVGNIVYDPNKESKVVADSSFYLAHQTDDFFAYEYQIPFFQERVSNFKMEDIFGRILTASFENCSTAEDYYFNRVYRSPLPDNQEIYLSLTLSDLELNQAKSLKFEIPSHYTWY